MIGDATIRLVAVAFDSLLRLSGHIFGVAWDHLQCRQFLPFRTLAVDAAFHEVVHLKESEVVETVWRCDLCYSRWAYVQAA